MTVEVAPFINSLNAAFPQHTDGLQEADGHMRVIKSSLKATFPNLTAAVTATAAEINTLPGRTTTLEANRARLDVANAFAASQHVVGNVNVTGKLYESSNVLLPSGVIILWSGLATAIPAGWKLCDGSSGTPDLRNRFIMGAGLTGTPTVGATGGGSTAAGTTTSGGAVSAANTSAAGGHAHYGATGSTVLNTDQIPSHNHVGTVSDPGHSHSVAQTYGGGWSSAGAQSGASYGIVATNTSGSFTGIAVTVEPSGGGLGHTHTISNESDHTHVVSAISAHTHDVTVATVPPYHVLCFIQKI